MPRIHPALAALAVTAMLGACSSDDGGNPTTLSVAKTATASGDAQNGTAGIALTNPLRVAVSDGGILADGETVTWATTSGGSLSPATSTTDVNGVATTIWTLGPGGGAQTATATVAGASGSPVTFTASSPVVPTITVAPGGALVFSPVTITISAGQSVRFVWAGGATNHNVSPDVGNASPLPSSPGLPALLNAPQDFNAVFPTAGTFKFFCTAHGANPSAGSVTGMSGTVTVN